MSEVSYKLMNVIFYIYVYRHAYVYKFFCCIMTALSARSVSGSSSKVGPLKWVSVPLSVLSKAATLCSGSSYPARLAVHRTKGTQAGRRFI